MHEALTPNEELCYLLEGGLVPEASLSTLLGTKKPTGVGVVALTDRRVIFYRKSIIGTTTMQDFPLQKITSAVYRKGLWLASVDIHVAGAKSLVRNCNKDEAKRFVDKLNASLHSTTREDGRHSAASGADELERWHKLKEQGIISEDEFIAKKRQLLG